MPLVEVLGTSRSHATPGWAYVPDTRGSKSNTATTATIAGRKRGIREPGGRTDLTSRQNHAIIRHLAELDRENHRDNVHVPVPVRKDAIQRDNGRAARAKTTSNVRRIMQSQKTFRNYLDDEEAAMAQQTVTGAAAAGTPVMKVARLAGTRSVTPLAKKQEETAMNARQKRALARKPTTTKGTSTQTGPTTEIKTEPTKDHQDADAMQVDEQEQQQQEQPPIIKGLIKTPYDNDHLLKSYLPNPPSDRLMAALLAEPPLRYHAARAAPSTSGKPARHFCTICGYWGKIKCRNCGVRTCGLECYKVHEDSRCGAFF